MAESTVSGPFRSENGFQQLDENGEWAPVAGAITSVNAGAGISVSPPTGNVIVTNTGVTSVIAGTGVSASASTGAVTLANTGVTSVIAGSGVSVSQSTGAVTISATGGGVTSITAGPNITVSSSTGNVTISASGGGPAVTVYLDETNAYSDNFTTPSIGNYIEIPKTIEIGQVIRFYYLKWGLSNFVWRIYLPQPVGQPYAAPNSTGAPAGVYASMWSGPLITTSPSYTYPNPTGIFQVDALASSGPNLDSIYFYGTLSAPGYIDIMRGENVPFSSTIVVANFNPVTPLNRNQSNPTQNRAPKPTSFPAVYS